MATVEQRVGRGGFTGSSITAWCETCDDYAVFNGNGLCVWDETQIAPRPRPGPAPDNRRPPPVVRGLTEAGIRAAHDTYTAGSVALLDVAMGIFVGRGYSGYRTASTLRDALRRAFVARGLPLRTQSEAARMRRSRP